MRVATAVFTLFAYAMARPLEFEWTPESVDSFTTGEFILSLTDQRIRGVRTPALLLYAATAHTQFLIALMS